MEDVYTRHVTPGCVKEGYLFKKSSSKMLQVCAILLPTPHFFPDLLRQMCASLGFTVAILTYRVESRKLLSRES